MKDYLNDLRKYYLLYLILLIGLIFVSTISHVFLVKFIRLPWYDFDVLLIFVLPFLLTIFSVYKILKQKFDEIEPTNIQTKLNIKSFFTFLLVLPIIASQYYIDARLNRMIDINSISNIKDYPTDKYFKIHDYNIDKNIFKVEFIKTLVDKRRSRISYGFNLDSFVVFDFDTNSEDFIWFGLNYRKFVKNNQPLNDSQLLIQLKQETEEFISKYIPYENKTFTRVSHQNNKKGYLKTIRNQYPNILPIQIEILEPEIPDFNLLKSLMLKVFLSFFVMCNIIAIIYSMKIGRDNRISTKPQKT